MNAKLIFASLVALALPVVAQSAEAQGGAAGQDPVKVLVFLTQRSDRTRDAVMSYYVDHHSKLARRLLPPINHYTLNFTRPETAGIPPTAKPLDFSMVTEITFQSETSYAEFIGLTQVPEVRQPIDADEKNMTDQPQTRMVRVDEVVIPGGGTAMGSSDPVKALVFLTPKPGLTRDQVMDYYVNKHTKLVRRLLPMINNYTLNFTRSETAFVPATAPPFDFGMVTEITFTSEARWQEFQDAIKMPDIIHAINRDEGNFTDQPQTRIIRVDERVVPHEQ